jgi:periplasmic protein TonB
MHARLQGVVVLEAVVMPDGSVGTVRIVRSLDPNGLDKEAVRTVKLWRFTPGRKDGKPVASLVQVDMAFTLR